MIDEFNTNWDDVPDTDKKAVPIDWRAVKNVCAVQVAGRIRNAQVSDCFELASDMVGTIKPYADHFRIELKCLWYGRKPKVTWMHITIDEHKIIEHFTGRVVSNIGRK